MIRSHLAQPGYRSAIFWVAALPVLYFISSYNYNLFHSLVDGASIIIAASVFVIIWNVRRILDNDYFLYVGISFLFFAFLDLMHVLGNKNMGAFPEYGNLGPAFYIASRYILSISLLIAPLFINRKLNSTIMFALYSLFTSFILLSIFYWRIFPVCIVEGVGLTPFKVISDYVICFIFLGAIGLLLIKRRSFDPGILRIMVSSIILFIATGVTFTLYADPFGIMNSVGHFLQIASFYLVYLAMIETSLTKPQDVLYRKLKQSEEKLADKVKQLDYANVELKQEITERKRAGEALKQSEQRYRSLHAELELRVRERTAELQSTLSALEESERRFREVLENSLDAAYRRNLQTDRYDYMSPAIASISGYTPEELFEMATEEVAKLIHPDDAAPVKAHIEECLIKEEKQCLLEYRFRHKDGSYRWFSDFVAIVKDYSGRPLYRVGTVRDITIRKRSEQELKKYSSKLEMINQKLQEFVFVAAHDLSEPLRKIQTFGSLLEAKTADRLDEQERNYLSRMTRAADRMRELLDALLKYSRLDAKEQEFKPAKLDDVVRDAVAELEVVIRKIEARIKIDKLPIVLGDPSQLRHLFHNLIGNSLKYYRPEVKTLVRVYGEDNDGDCRIFVEDNGIGFDEKYLDKIFQPFQRLHGKNEYSGTGIGLAICKKIVERHKGAINVRSTPGKGSTVIVTLPVDGTTVARKPE